MSGPFCEAYCRVVSANYAVEEKSLVPDLTRPSNRWDGSASASHHEHERYRSRTDQGRGRPGCHGRGTKRADETVTATDHLGGTLLAHVKYEEEWLRTRSGGGGTDLIPKWRYFSAA
jgi:hypothetical protein